MIKIRHLFIGFKNCDMFVREIPGNVSNCLYLVVQKNRNKFFKWLNIVYFPSYFLQTDLKPGIINILTVVKQLKLVLILF